MRWEKILLLLGVGCMFIHISRKLVYSFAGVDITYGFSMAGILFIALAIHRYRQVLGPAPTSFGFQVHWVLYVLTLALLAVYGYFRNGLVQYLAADLLVYGLIALFMVAGKWQQFWDDVQGPMLAIFWVGFVLVIACLGRPSVEFTLTGPEIGEEIKGGFRAEVSSLAYELRPYLDFWPVLFALAYQARSGGWRRFLGLATAPAFLLISIIFLKRAPSARTVAYVVTIVLGAGVLQGRLRVRTAMLTLGGVFLGCAIAGGIYLTQLRERFETAETGARFTEAAAMLQDMRGFDWIIGKGLGGYFIPPAGWRAGIVYVSEFGVQGRTTLHVGLLMPLLKGGIIFAVMYYLFYFRVLWFKPRAWNDVPINFAARTVLAVYLLFQLIEGPLSLGDPFGIMMVGICCARGASAALQEQPLDMAAYDDPHLYQHDDDVGNAGDNLGPVGPGRGRAGTGSAGNREPAW